MNPNAKLFYTVLGILSIGTLFLQIWGILFGFIRTTGWPAISISFLCVFLALLAISALDPHNPKK